MRNYIWKIFIVFLLLSSIRSFSQTNKLRWSSSFSPSWQSGDTIRTANNINSSGINCSVTVSKSGGIFDKALSGDGPRTPTVSGATFTVPGSSGRLQVTMDFANSSHYCDITFSFSELVSDVSFLIVDIDRSASYNKEFHDQVTITGQKGTDNVYPSITRYSNTSPNFLIISGNTAGVNPATGSAGNADSDNDDQRGTVQVAFTGSQVNAFTIRYNNVQGVQANPLSQSIAIGNISFSKPVKPNLPPTAVNIVHPYPIRNDIQGSVTLDPLKGEDDEYVASYDIVTVPPASSGTLLYNSSGSSYDQVSSNTVLTPDQASTLKFTPGKNYKGTTEFTYKANDNKSLKSEAASYTIQITEPSLVIMPVRLSGFTASVNTGQVKLNWITSQEANSKTFMLERSRDGAIWSTVASMPAAGNSTTALSYTATDREPGMGLVYYRLLIVDADGQQEHSHVISAVTTASATVRIYPNPFIASISVTLRHEKETRGTLYLLNGEGKLMHRSAISLQKGINTVSTGKLGNLPPGNYMIRIAGCEGNIIASGQLIH